MKKIKLFCLLTSLSALSLTSCLSTRTSYSSSFLIDSNGTSSFISSSSFTSEESSKDSSSSSKKECSSSSIIGTSSELNSSSYSSSENNSSSNIASSSVNNSSSSAISSSSQAPITSSQISSSSELSSSHNSSSSSSSSNPISSSSQMTSNSTSMAQSSSSEVPSSSSQIPSSSSQSVSSSSSQIPNSSSNPISSSSYTPSSSSNKPSSSSSSMSSSSSSSTTTPIDPLADYQTIATFSKRMPAEFEPSMMIKMCYPNNMPIAAYKTIAEDNKILLLVNPNSSNKSRITAARSALVNGGVNVDNVTFIDMPIDDDYGYWVRDFSPFYVFDNQDLSVVDFTYNRPRYEQNAVPSKLADYFSMSYAKMNITHTGGNLMQDGRGTAFSDDLVVSENGNNKTKVLNQMKQYTGTDNYVITIDPQGDYIAHIDCWGKIVAPDKIIVAKLPKSNARYQYYEQVATQLANTKCAYGYNYRIYRIEEPGEPVVAPYTNSLIANGHVYMPLGDNATYNEKALEVYKEALPGYEVIGIKGFASNDSHHREFLNTDALHCRTHEVPDQNMVFIDSREVYNGEVALKEHYVIKTNVVSYAKEEINDVIIHYSINDGAYQTAYMNQYQETTNYTYVFSNLSKGDAVKYYIEAHDKANNHNIDPTCGELDPHHFSIAVK